MQVTNVKTIISTFCSFFEKICQVPFSFGWEIHPGKKQYFFETVDVDCVHSPGALLPHTLLGTSTRYRYLLVLTWMPFVFTYDKILGVINSKMTEKNKNWNSFKMRIWPVIDWFVLTVPSTRAQYKVSGECISNLQSLPAVPSTCWICWTDSLWCEQWRRQHRLNDLPVLWASCWPPHRSEECGPHTTPRSPAPKTKQRMDKWDGMFSESLQQLGFSFKWCSLLCKQTNNDLHSLKRLLFTLIILPALTASVIISILQSP